MKLHNINLKDQSILIGFLIHLLTETLKTDKMITKIEVWLEGEEKPYIDLKQRRISPEISNILDGVGGVDVEN